MLHKRRTDTKAGMGAGIDPDTDPGTGMGTGTGTGGGKELDAGRGLITELVQHAQRGDGEALFQLIQADKERLYRIAFAYLKNQADAVEAIQEATCRAFGKLHQLKEPAFFYTWLIRILIRYCIDEQKRKRKSLPLLQVTEQLAQELDLDARLQLELAVEKLKPKYRHIIILKYYQDMTLTQIASLLEKPEGTVKTWLHKALGILRAELAQGGGRNG